MFHQNLFDARGGYNVAHVATKLRAVAQAGYISRVNVADRSSSASVNDIYLL